MTKRAPNLMASKAPMGVAIPVAMAKGRVCTPADKVE